MLYDVHLETLLVLPERARDLERADPALEPEVLEFESEPEDLDARRSPGQMIEDLEKQIKLLKVNIEISLNII